TVQAERARRPARPPRPARRTRTGALQRARGGRSRRESGGERGSKRYVAAMIVERSMDPRWLSNAYLVAGAPGGTAVFLDTGAPLEPLLEAVEAHGLTVTHVLRTHAHPDHVAGEGEVVRRFDAPVVTGELETGGISVEAIPCPGHSDDGVSFLVNGGLLFS